MSKVDDKSYRITRGGEFVGWCRVWAGGTWEAKSAYGHGWGQSPEEAFAKFVKHAPRDEPQPVRWSFRNIVRRDKPRHAQPLIDFGRVKLRVSR